MKKSKKKPSVPVLTPEMRAMAATPEEFVAVSDAVATAARAAAPGYEVIVVVIQPAPHLFTPPFRVNWGPMVTDRAAWILNRVLKAVDKLT